jgi:short-subunit dehydrogenase
MSKTAWIIGNTDGIGLSLTRRLLSRGWQVTGLSRSHSDLSDSLYQHHVADVAASDYPATLERLLERDIPELVIYCAGIGEELNLTDMHLEARTFEVNLLGMVRTAAAVIPPMVARKSGHFIGLSSLCDELVLADLYCLLVSSLTIFCNDDRNRHDCLPD